MSFICTPKLFVYTTNLCLEGIDRLIFELSELIFTTNSEIHIRYCLNYGIAGEVK